MFLKDYISERPQIWNTNSEGFRHSQARQSAFTEVAQLLSDQHETYTSGFLNSFLKIVHFIYYQKIIRKSCSRRMGQVTLLFHSNREEIA